MNFRSTLIGVMIVLSGCAWLGPKRTALPQAALTISSDRVVERERLQKGGTIAIVPFTPGVNVEANQTTDRTVLMIVKGITESLGSPFQVVFGDAAADADFIISGRITEINRTGLLQRGLLLKDKISLAIDGKMEDQVTGNVVAIFQNKRDSQSKNQTVDELGYIIGEDIGRFLMVEVGGK